VDSKITTNLILQQLPSLIRQELAAHLEPLRLTRGQELSLGDDVLFPLGAVFSLIDTSQDGFCVEAGFVGFEGLLAIGPIPNLKAEVQVGGESLRLSRAVYEDLQDNRDFRRVTDTYRDRLLGLAFQKSVCVISHRTEQRLASSLLAVMDRCGQDGLDLTHDYLAARLGVTRPTVTIAAGLLQSKGLISHRYGHMTILDAPGLVGVTCPCFAKTHAMLLVD